MRKGFTMIELIFVIVILGILAAVAVPKLSATRDDAKISKMATNIQTAKSEMAAYIVATGVTSLSGDANMSAASNVIKDLNTSGEASVSGTQTSFNDKDNGNETCMTMDFNGTHILVANGTGTGTICTGVQSLVKTSQTSVRGQNVKY